MSAGDSVFFKRGDRFDGHFVVNGSGTKHNPIVISAYGKGNLPIITGEVGAEGGGDYQEAILVENQSHITLENLEVNNERKTPRKGVRDNDAYGIYIFNSGDEVMRGFTLKNLTIKNVYAPMPVLRDAGENAFNGLVVSGITFFCSRNKIAGKEKNIRDILVEGCYFTDLQRLGVHIKHIGGDRGVGNDSINRNMDVVVRNNEFHSTGGTCVLPIRTYNCLIDNNLFDRPGSDADPRMPNRGSSVWTWYCNNTVIQHNRCISARGYLDSHGIHIDHGNRNTIIQYNYMEDCEGGFVEILHGNVNSVYRFNISVNDGWRVNPKWKNSNHTIWINSDNKHGAPKPCNGSYIYNNAVFMDSAYTTAIDIKAKNTYIYNNVFHAIKGANIGGKQVHIKTHETDFLLSNNLYHGIIDERFMSRDKKAIIPKATDALAENAYQSTIGKMVVQKGLSKQGPALPVAKKGVFMNVSEFATKDFFGNPVDLSAGTPDVGAWNGTGTDKKAITLTENEIDFAEPNLCFSEITIDLKDFSDKKVTVSLYDMHKRLQQTETLEVEGTVKLTVDPKVRTGMYLLEVKSDNMQRKAEVFILQ